MQAGRQVDRIHERGIPRQKISRGSRGRRRAAASAMQTGEIVSFGLAGIAIGISLVIGLHYLNQQANANVATRRLTPLAAPISALQSKEDPLRPVVVSVAYSPDAYAPAMTWRQTQQVARDGKDDMLSIAPDEELRSASLGRPKKEATPRILHTPPIWKLERSWRMARAERARLLAERKKRLRERMCLAKAIYFEARSESLRGQLAVARVVLNRVRDPRFPNTICGVVYQGAERRNACQFSFACDGKPDYPTNRRHWAKARRLAAKVLRGQIRLPKLDGVAFYHADYVRPTWASVMRPVIKIGRHIFYRDS